MIADRLRALAAPVRAWAARRRKPLLVAAAVLFTGLLVWAVRDADLTLEALDWRYLALNAFVLTPATLALNGWGITAIGWALGARVSPGLGVATAATGTVAELTPAPGGLLARATVLTAAGAPPRPLAQTLTACAGMFIGMSMMAAALSLVARGDLGVAPLIIGAVGLVGMLIGLGLLIACCAPGGVLVLWAHRLASLMLALCRVWCAFAAVGAPIAWGDAPLFVAAGVIGALVFVVPAGMGVVELVAAGAAPLIGVGAAAAIAATALNRLLGLGLAALVVSLAVERVSRGPDWGDG